MTHSAPHERYRERMGALRSSPLLEAIAQHGAQRMWWPRGLRWKISFGRFTPHASSFAELVVEAVADPRAICRVVVSEQPSDPSGDDESIVELPVGWLHLWRWPSDPRLNTLPEVLHQGPSRVVRYRPLRRCTIKFDFGHRTQFAKVFPDDRGASIHAGGVALWAVRDQLDFVVSRPDRFDPSTRTVWQDAAAGVPATARLIHGPRRGDLAGRIGAALASLHRSNASPPRLHGARSQMERSTRHAGELATTVPHLDDRLRAVMAALERLHATRDQDGLRSIHGSPHADQWLVDGERLALVDIDRFSLGDPEADAASFLTEFDFEDKEAASEVRDAFIDEYERSGEPLDRRLLSAYRIHKHISKALNAARSLRRDGDRVADRRLETIERMLDRVMQ